MQLVHIEKLIEENDILEISKKKMKTKLSVIKFGEYFRQNLRIKVIEEEG